MKTKLLLISMTASLLLFSCKKDQNSRLAQKTVAITFNVNSGVTTSTGTLAASGNSEKGRLLAAAIPVSTKYLTALFYDNNSKLLQRIDQVKDSTANFGSFTVNLTSGIQVFAFFIATADKNFSIVMSKLHSQSVNQMPNGYPTMTYPDSYFGPTTTNIFSSPVTFTVASTPTTRAVVMPRIVSQLNLVTLDLANSNTYYNYEQYNPLNAYDLLMGTGEHNNKYLLVSQTLFPTVGTTGSTFTFNVWPGTGNTHVMFGAVQKTLFASTDTIKANTRYIISGYYYSERVNNITITTDTTWNKTIIKTIGARLGKITLQ